VMFVARIFVSRYSIAEIDDTITPAKR